MLRYAIYARKSDDDRRQTEKSIGEQVGALRSLAEQHGLAVVKEHEESQSAMRPGVRPLYTALIHSLERSQVDAILCWKLNRLVRNMEEGGKLAQLLVEGKIKEIRTPYAVYRPGDNIFPLVIDAAQAAQFSLSLREDVVRGMDGHAARGGWNAKAYFGYRNERHPINNEIGVVVPDGDRFGLVRRAWEMMLTGDYTPGEVARTLNDEWGFRSKPTPKGGGQPMSRSQAYHLFRNPFYAGYIRYKGKLMTGNHQAMITDEEFNRVQELLDKHLRPHRRRHEYAYVGLMRCGYCGRQITGEERILRNGQLWVNYRCANAHCSHAGLSERKLETQLAEVLKSVTIDRELYETALDNLNRTLDERKTGAQTVHSQQEASLDQVRRKLANLEQMWLLGLMTDQARYQGLERDLRKEEEKLTLAVGRGRDEVTAIRRTTERTGRFAVTAYRAFLVGNRDERRQIATALGTQYLLFGREKRLEVICHPTLTALARYSRQIVGSIEPTEVGSLSTQSSSFLPGIRAGGPDEAQIEPYSALEDSFSDAWFPEVDLPE